MPKCIYPRKQYHATFINTYQNKLWWYLILSACIDSDISNTKTAGSKTKATSREDQETSLPNVVHLFNGPLSGTARLADTNLDFTEARDSGWQWHQMEHMQAWTSLQTDNHANTTAVYRPDALPATHQTHQSTETAMRGRRYDSQLIISSDT